MKNPNWIMFASFLLTFPLILTACLPTSGEGIPLFDDEQDQPQIETTETAAETVTLEEFGFTEEDSICTVQLHGGCVPTGYKKYENLAFTLPFVYSSNDWLPSEVDQFGVGFSPTETTGENDPTVFKIWRQPMYDTTYDNAKETLIDSGEGIIGPYAATWEIYEGVWNEVPVKAEWVTLVVDEKEPLINYVYFVMTETENFEKDETAVLAAASSILMD